MDMDVSELDQAIYGAQLREANLYRFLRLIAWGILAWIGAFPKPIKVEEWWPLITDPPVQKVDHKKAREEMKEVFRKRDEARKKSANK